MLPVVGLEDRLGRVSGRIRHQHQRPAMDAFLVHKVLADGTSPDRPSPFGNGLQGAPASRRGPEDSRHGRTATGRLDAVFRPSGDSVRQQRSGAAPPDPGGGSQKLLWQPGRMEWALDRDGVDPLDDRREKWAQSARLSDAVLHRVRTERQSAPIPGASSSVFAHCPRVGWSRRGYWEATATGQPYRAFGPPIESISHVHDAAFQASLSTEQNFRAHRVSEYVRYFCRHFR